MAENTDSNYKVTDEEREIIGVGLKSVDSGKLTPKQSREKLKSLEDGVLGNIRDHDRSFLQRLGRFAVYLVPGLEGERMNRIGDFKEKIKELASDKANHVIGKMGNLQESAKKRLSLLGRKSAEKLAGLTARIEIAQEAKAASEAYMEHVREEQKERAQIAKFVMAQAASEGSWKNMIPLRRRLVLWKTERSFPKETGHEDPLLKKAATEVENEAMRERKEYDQETRERFKNIRGAEGALREHILRYNPNAVDVIEIFLRECAAGEDTNLRGLIQNLNLAHYPEKQQEEIRDFLHSSVRVLTGREAELAKAFEVFGRLELKALSGAELVRQIQSLPLGTHLTVKSGEALKEREMVVMAKRPEGRVVLKRMGSGTRTDRIILIPDQGVGLRTQKNTGKKGAPSNVEVVFNLKDAVFSLAS